MTLKTEFFIMHVSYTVISCSGVIVQRYQLKCQMSVSNLRDIPNCHARSKLLTVSWNVINCWHLHYFIFNFCTAITNWGNREVIIIKVNRPEERVFRILSRFHWFCWNKPPFFGRVRKGQIGLNFINFTMT